MKYFADEHDFRATDTHDTSLTAEYRDWRPSTITLDLEGEGWPAHSASG